MFFGNSARTKRRKADEITSIGVGPFTPQTIRALRQRECMSCGGAVYEFALTANALVVEQGQVNIYCDTCRGATVEHMYDFNGQLDIDDAIIALNEHVCVHSGEKLDYFETLICMRFGYAYFQTNFPTQQAFYKKRYLKQGLPYGQLLNIGNCGECGAFWAHPAADGATPKPSYSDGESWDEVACWACGFPHNLQWNMRVTAEEERKRLIMRSTQYAP